MVEFALIVPIFLIMVLGTIEFSIYVFKRNFVKHVLYEMARDIQTGEIQTADDPETAFNDLVCANSSILFSCNDLYFDVRSFKELKDAKLPDAAFNGSTPANFVFKPGKSEEITVMRVATPYHFVTPFMQDIFQPSGEPMILIGFTMGKNEPFGCVKKC